MDFLGNPSGSGVSPEQEEKLDAITVEPSGEVKFDNGIIVNGGATELKTTVTEVDDPILQINRANNSTISGFTIRNADDGKFNSIIKSGTNYWFTQNTLSDDTLAPSANERANIICGNVNSVNVGQLNGDYNLHVANSSIHTPLDDLQTTSNNLWSATKIASEITAGAGAVIDDVTPALDKVYSSSKTQTLNNTVQNNLTNLETSATRALIQDATQTSSIALSNIITSTSDEHKFVYNAGAVVNPPTYVWQYSTQTSTISNGGLTSTFSNSTGNRSSVTEDQSWFSYGDQRQFKVIINSFSGPGLALGITRWAIPQELPSINDIPNQTFIKVPQNVFVYTNGAGFNFWNSIDDVPLPGQTPGDVLAGHSVEFKIESNGEVYLKTETTGDVFTLIYTLPNNADVWKFWMGDNTDLASNATVTSVAPTPSGGGGGTPGEKLSIADDVTVSTNLSVTGDLTTGLVNSVDVAQLNTDFNLHSGDTSIHFTIDDNVSVLDKVYSSSKTQTIVNNAQNNLTNHVNDSTIHFTIDDNVSAFDKVYSSSKTQTLHNTVQNNLTNLETSATRALIQDTTGETKIELSQPELSLTSGETKIIYNQPSGATQPYQPLWSSAGNRLSGTISLASGNTIANFSNTNITRAVLGDASQDFTISDVPRVIRFQINSANARSIAIGLVNITDSGLPMPVGGLPLQYHSTIMGYNTAVPASDWATNNFSNFQVHNTANTLFPGQPTVPAFQNGDIIRWDIDAVGNVTISQEFTLGATWAVAPTVGNILVGKTYSVFAWDFSGVNSDASITLLQGQEPGGGGITPVEKVSVGDIVDIKTNVNIQGDLTVSGTTTTVNTDNITIEDPLIKLANNNITNVTNIGFIGQYNDGNPKFCGLMQTYSSGDWNLIGGTTQVPSELVVPAYLNTELAILNLNKARLTEVLPYIPVQGIRLINGTEELKVGNNSIDFTNTSFNVNSVQQDTAVSAFGQYYVDFSLTNPFTTLLNSGYATAFPIPPSNTTGANVGFNSATNTFTIQHAGWYRFSYHISIRNVDDDKNFIQVSLQKNGVQNDAFELSSMTRHLRQRNRVTTLSATFIHNMAVNDTVRMYLEAFTDAGAGGTENIDVFDVNVNVERLFTNF